MIARRWGAAAGLIAAIIWTGGSGDARACGPFFTQIQFTNAVYPGDQAAFARGDLGVIRPRYVRQSLALAYRRLTGVAPAGPDTVPTVKDTSDRPRVDPLQRWEQALALVPAARAAAGRTISQERSTPEYSHFLNCPDDAFVTAAETLRSRVEQFGASSPDIQEWVRAQRAVFANCVRDAASPMVLPEPTSPGLPALLAADRAYQVAAAHFYGLDYEGAEGLFRAIAEDSASPWRTSGRYLAARALIRRATVPSREGPEADQEEQALLAQAEAELGDVLADPSAADLRESARGLRQWIQVRLRPIDRLVEAAAHLASDAAPSAQDYIDFSRLANSQVSVDVTYPYSIVERHQALRGVDLTDWIVAMQGQGEGAQARAMERWQKTRSLPWLIAALWRTPGVDAAVEPLLAAAADVPASSPAFATVAYLRVQRKIDSGELDEARALLEALPDAPGPGFPQDAINLFRSERLRVARTLDEWLRAAPRMPIGAGGSFSDAAAGTGLLERPSFDVDAAVALSEQFPLHRLADIVRSEILPARLRLKVAIAAWTRAVQLKDDQAGLAIAPVLRSLAPAMRADVDRYIAAAGPAQRHASGILLLLRWPGMRNYVPLTEEQRAYASAEPRSNMARDAVGVNWWCGFEPAGYRAAGPYDWQKESPVSTLPMVAGTTTLKQPLLFLAPDEQAVIGGEWQRLARLGPAATYLATEAAAWAETRPNDAEIPEALARAVQATRFGCGDDNTGRASQRAFALLHKRHPDTTWAKQTPYWYNGR